MLKENLKPLQSQHTSIREVRSLVGERLVEFTVLGRVGPHSTIPVDMLRYDGCWPATSQDAVNMMQADEPKTVEIRLYGLRCTPGRWASFMWKVL